VAKHVRKPRLVRVLVVAAVAVIGGRTVDDAGAAAGWTGTRIISALQERRLALEGATIAGDIDFRSFDVVRHPFSCQNCTIVGRVLGDDVVFDSTLDFSGAQISKSVLMRRARFRGPALFGSTTGSSGRDTSFAGRIDFSFARFDELVTFDAASFHNAADFANARFRSASVFADATFAQHAMFDRAMFADGADFRGVTFRRNATFAAAQFADRADFSRANFASGVADFRNVRFDRDATFLGSTFTYDGGDALGVTFEGAIAQHDLVFDLATFYGGAIFHQTVAGGLLSFNEIVLSSTRKPFVFSGSSAKGIAMAVGDAMAAVAHGPPYDDDRPHVLRLIEAGAKATGDLGVANDARFSLESLESRRGPWWRRTANVVFYRLIAGYFVRPFHPIVALLVLAVLVAIARASQIQATTTGLVGRGRVRLAATGHEFLEALALIGPHGAEDPRRGRRMETFVYRVLILCALIALGNSNPTLREMFDAIV
jgi:Pentapeptide repeats (9 copies)